MIVLCILFFCYFVLTSIPQTCDQVFDGFHGHGKKYKRLTKAFMFLGIFQNPVPIKLFDNVFEDCVYRFTTNSENWYYSSVVRCLEELPNYAENVFEEKLKFELSAETVRMAIRGSGSTTYLNFKGEIFDWMDYCVRDFQFYYFNLKLMEFVDHRPYFHGKFDEDDFVFFREQLEVGVMTKTEFSDRIWIELFDYAVVELVEKDLSAFSDCKRRKSVSHFLEFTYRMMNIRNAKSCDELIGKECALILKSFKKEFNLCYTLQKGGVRGKKNIIKRESPYVEKVDGVEKKKLLPCQTHECYHFVFQYVLEMCKIITITFDKDKVSCDYSSNLGSHNYLDSISCASGLFAKHDVHRCPRVDYGFFDINMDTSPCERCFGRMVTKFPKGKHKGLCNYDGDCSLNFLECAHCQAQVIREDELAKGIDIEPDIFWHLGNPKNFWGGKDFTFEEFLVEAGEEFLKKSDWCGPWKEERSRDLRNTDSSSEE